MESEDLTCSVCSMPYDTTDDHIPRVLINCGHTLCTSCLIEIINNQNLRKCPLDSSLFKKSQKSLDHFPRNFALVALLEGKKRNTCKIHGEELKMFYLKDKMKICSDCAFFGEHQEHSTKWIKEMKGQGAKLKKALEESLEKFEKKRLEEDQSVETLKNGFLRRVGDRFEEVKMILQTKELEWRKQVENLFERNLNCHSESLLKQEASKALEEIDQARQKEENLAILNQEFSSIISRLLQPQVTKEEVSKISDETSKMTDCIESFLKTQAIFLKDFDLSSNERVKSEQKQQQIFSENSIKTKQEPVFFQTSSLFKLGVSHEIFFIRVKNPNPIDTTATFGTSNNKLQKVSIELDQYDSLFKNSAYLNSLSEFLHQLNNFTSLTGSFAPEGLTDSRALHLFNILFVRIQHLDRN